MGFTLQGSATGNPVESDASGNLLVALPKVHSLAGYVRLACENDAGAMLGGVASLKMPRASSDSRLSVGVDTPLFDASFSATSQNTAIWRHVFLTMTMIQTGGFLNVNANANLVATNSCSLQSRRHFSLLGNGDLHWEMTGAITAMPVANQVFETGFFTPNAAAAPLDGVYFRLTSAGLIGCVNYNGVETTTGVLLDATSIPPNVNGQYKIILSTRAVSFWLDGNLAGTLTTPSGNGAPFIWGALPLGISFRNVGTVGVGGMIVKIANVHVDQVDLNLGRGYESILAGMGLTGAQGQDGGTMGSTALYTNSLAAGAGAVMTNTTAALGVGLGGQFSALPTLAAGTDGILCSYLNPVGSASQPPGTLYINSITIQGVVTTALVGNATPAIFAFSACFGHTALSLATAESASFATATAKAPRRLTLGIEKYAAAAALGDLGSAGITVNFNTPIAVNPGEYFAISAKNLGAVTTTGVITWLVNIGSYVE
jgi:hypothetical protein